MPELAENHTMALNIEGPTPNFHHFTGRLPRQVSHDTFLSLRERTAERQ
jgi:hypothetical protein